MRTHARKHTHTGTVDRDRDGGGNMQIARGGNYTSYDGLNHAKTHGRNNNLIDGSIIIAYRRLNNVLPPPSFICSF